MATPPKSIKEIQNRLRTLGPLDADRKARVIANVIASQMLPESALRGGTSLKLKYGDSTTRASSDLDVALKIDRNTFVEQYRTNLALGWNGFTGVLTESRSTAKPEGIPETYITETWKLKLSYRGSEWLNQEIDIAHDEIGDTNEFSNELSEEIWGWFEICGLPTPKPVRVIKAHHQIAQKIHALIDNPVERIHDLVDLQVIFNNQKIDYALTGSTCRSLFKSRRILTWPPTLPFEEELSSQYLSFVEETGVISSLEEATQWLNGVISKLDSAESEN